jgi:nucleotide-binding universal stress UspA family protein
MAKKKEKTCFVKTMRNFFKTFADSMTAATFAEAGEFETAKLYLAQSKNAHKRILFSTNAMDITPTTLSRVIGICKRIGAALEILHVLPSEVGDTCRAGKKSKNQCLAGLASLKEQLKAAGIFYEFVVGINSIEEEIIRHVSGRRDVMMVVLGLGHDKNEKKAASHPDSRLMEQLKCPVILLGEPQSA